MAYINFNHKKMIDTAEEIEECVVRLEQNMENIDSAVVALGSEWKGIDYNQVKAEWDEINAEYSTTDKMKTNLKNYATSIRGASKLYKEAQVRAVNRANALCK